MLDVQTVTLTLPTYPRGSDDPHSPLTFGRALRSGRRPYPYHMQDDIDIATMGTAVLRDYRAVRLSNGILEAIVLPDMNGRLYSLRDLRNGRELFYRNNVVKPALVALRGAWISGGIEFNFPTLGHSVSTVSPVLFRTETQSDEVAVVVGDLDRCTRQWWQVRLSLRSGRAALDLETRLHNPNDWRERLYYWENAAVPGADDLRFVCKCDWVVGQTAREFPLRNGVDVSRYTGNPRPVDHFGYRSRQDFFGAYYGDSRAGTYHVGRRIDNPGQKYFTWGTEADSRIWLNYLTDSDGQYVEIQSGILESQWFTGWLEARETLVSRGSWFGTADMGEATWANDRLAAAVSTAAGCGEIALHSIDCTGAVTLRLAQSGRAEETTLHLLPGEARVLPCPAVDPFDLHVYDARGALLMQEAWHGVGNGEADPRRDRTAPTIWLMEHKMSPAGQLDEAEQYHRWDHLEELLKAAEGVTAPPGARLNQAYASLKSGGIAMAWGVVAQALRDNPLDSRLHALATVAELRRLQSGDRGGSRAKLDDHALAARRDGRFADAVLLQSAEASVLAGRELDAFRLLDGAAVAGLSVEPRTYVLYSGVCRHTGRVEMARGAAARFGGICPLFTAGERFLAGDSDFAVVFDPAGENDPAARMQVDETILEWLLFYWRLHWFTDLTRLVEAVRRNRPGLDTHPLFALLRADLAGRFGMEAEARSNAMRAATADLAFVAPKRWEDDALLTLGLRLLPAAEAPALVYLRALWDCQNGSTDEGTRCLAGLTRSGVPAAIRRRAAKALADWHDLVRGDDAKAAHNLGIALRCGEPDRRLVLTQDEVMHRLQRVPERRRLWKRIPESWRDRGDVRFRLARLHLDCDEPDACLELLLATQFSVHEGGTLIRRLYVDASLVAGLTKFIDGDLAAAATAFRRVLEYPENLGAASYLGEHSRLARFLLGLGASRAGADTEAMDWWRSVIAHEVGGTAYAVGAVAKRLALRADERLALELVQCRLGLAVGRRVPPAAPAAGSSEDGVDGVVATLCDAIGRGETSAPTRAAAALTAYPCNALVRILHGLAQVRPRR